MLFLYNKRPLQNAFSASGPKLHGISDVVEALSSPSASNGFHVTEDANSRNFGSCVFGRFSYKNPQRSAIIQVGDIQFITLLTIENREKIHYATLLGEMGTFFEVHVSAPSLDK